MWFIGGGSDPDRVGFHGDAHGRPITAPGTGDFIVFGPRQGSIYALIAMGYRWLRHSSMINFAHSELYERAYTAFFVAVSLDASGFLDRQPSSAC